MAADPAPQGRPVRDMAFYERLIRRGLAEADARGSAIDHLTARRLALWLIPRSQQDPECMRGLVYFARTGGVPDSLRQALRRQSRSPAHPNRSQAAGLLQYAVARGRDTGRIGDNFGAVCDQMDHADAVLEDLQRQRGNPEPTPARAGPPEFLNELTSGLDPARRRRSVVVGDLSVDIPAGVDDDHRWRDLTPSLATLPQPESCRGEGGRTLGSLPAPSRIAWSPLGGCPRYVWRL